MNKLVVDSSIVVKWFVTEPLSDESRHILDSYEKGALLLCAPDLLIAEIGNIIWKKHRQHGLTKQDAEQILDSFRELDIEIVPSIALLRDAFQIAVENSRTVYDSLYVALSKREQCSFVTADEKLVNAVHSKFPKVVWVVNWSE